MSLTPHKTEKKRIGLVFGTVLNSQPAGDMSHKPSGRLPLLSARPAVTLATYNRAATNFIGVKNVFCVFLFSKRFLFKKTLAKFRAASRLTRSTLFIY